MNRRRPSRLWSLVHRLPGRWLAIVLFGLSLVSGLAPVQTAPAATLDELAGLYADSLVICTPGGMVRSDGTGVPPAGRHATCVFCLPLSHPGGGLLAAHPPVLPPLSSPVAVAVARPSERPRSVRVRVAHAPRAPPAFLANV